MINRVRKWLKKQAYSRLPPARSIYLTQKNVFIFPSKAGFVFLVLIALLWLIATNYENNLIFALSFLLASLFVVCLLHTFSNLAGIEVTAIRSRPAFVGEDAEFVLLVQRKNQRDYENMLFSWPGMSPTIVNLTEEAQQRVKLYVNAKQRGWMRPGRLLLETYYPLGLFRTWTRMDLDFQTLVYPRPVAAGPVPAALGNQGDGSITTRTGTEDFYGLKEYRDGDSFRHVAWKQYARGQGLHTKEYVASVDRRLWLDWDYLAGMDRESRLSRLCYWVLEASKTNDDYGLRLPNLEIRPNKGVEHRDQLLKALALFEQKAEQVSGQISGQRAQR